MLAEADVTCFGGAWSVRVASLTFLSRSWSQVTLLKWADTQVSKSMLKFEPSSDTYGLVTFNSGRCAQLASLPL